MKLVPIAIVLVGSIAHAGAPDCSKAALRKARAAADKSMRAKDYKAAIATLLPVSQACGGDADKIEQAWLDGDLAVAYEKDGQPLECEKLMAPWSHPSSGLQDGGNDKLAAAIDYNLDHCAKDFDAQYTALKADACALTIAGASASVAAPLALAPKGATAACVALVPGDTCPDVALYWKKGAKVSHSVIDNDATHDPSFCCNLSAIAIGSLNGKTLVRVKGGGRECSGATADVDNDFILEWKGKTLDTVLDASIGFH